MAAPKLKIGLVLDTSLDSTDGVQQYVIQLGKWLRSKGHDVHYLVGESQRRDIPNVHSLARNITVSFNGNLTTIPLWASRRRLKRFIRQHNFDVLHVQTPHHPLLAQRLVLAAGPRTAVIGTFHVLPYGRLAAAGNKLLGIWLRPSLKRFDRMIAVSPVAAEFCRRSFGLNAIVVPNMVDYRLYNRAKPLAKYDDNILTILFLGRLVARKGCQVLLEAISLLKNEPALPAVRVVICGRGALEKQLKELVSEMGLEDIIDFVGFVSEADKPRYYASADMAVFPSSSGESFGIVLLEAMASGHTLVLAGDNPGYRSVMSPRMELLFSPNNVEELAFKLRKYLNDAPLRQDLTAWGERYTQAFDVAVVGENILSVYNQALHKRRDQ